MRSHYVFMLFVILLLCSCRKIDSTTPVCATSQVPQQITLDWAKFTPSYFEISATNTQVACDQSPFYVLNELNTPPRATTYNYMNQASAVPSATLIPSVANDKFGGRL